jgi:HSP20 family protein
MSMTQDLHTMAPEATSRLRANVYETAGGETYVLEIPVPGFTPDEITLEVEVDSLTVRTQPRQGDVESGRHYLQREQVTEPMSRIFEFPTEIDTDNVRASLENGVLKIRVPKAAAARRRVIRVGQGD